MHWNKYTNVGKALKKKINNTYDNAWRYVNPIPLSSFVCTKSIDVFMPIKASQRYEQYLRTNLGSKITMLYCTVNIGSFILSAQCRHDDKR